MNRNDRRRGRGEQGIGPRCSRTLPSVALVLTSREHPAPPGTRTLLSVGNSVGGAIGALVPVRTGTVSGLPQRPLSIGHERTSAIATGALFRAESRDCPAVVDPHRRNHYINGRIFSPLRTMRYRKHSHIDEWAALVGEDVGERVSEPALAGRENGAPGTRYRADTDQHTER